MRHAARALAVVVLLALFASGCGKAGGPRVKVSGKLLNNGQPYQVKDGEMLTVFFAGSGTGDKAANFEAEVKPDGTFTVPGPDGKGIPPGSYQIHVKSEPYGAGGNEEDAPKLDKFKGRFQSEKNPLKVEVAGGEDITIDLGKGTVSK